MMDKKKMVGLALLAIMLAMPMMISSVEATEWVEVTRQSGSAYPYAKEFSMQFECNHVEWRVRWSYEAAGSPFESVLLIQPGPLVLSTSGYSSRSGVRVCNGTGNFNLEVTCIGMNEYTIVVEQNVDSIPEFTPATLAIVLIAVSILAVALSKKFRKRR